LARSTVSDIVNAAHIGVRRLKSPKSLLSRRRLLEASLALGALPLSACAQPREAPPRYVNESVTLSNRLAAPPLLPPRMEGASKIFDLAAGEDEAEFLPGRKTRVFGFNGGFLGPTLRLRQQENVVVRVSNRLREPTTSHWHGMILPAAMDGGPHQAIAPGATWRAHWTVRNEASTLWYHSHLMGRTGEQVYRGLAGLIIVDDDTIDRLGLPSDYGVDDIPLIVQDRRFDRVGQFVYDPGMRNSAPPGMLGDVILVNGLYAPFAEVPRRLVRLRILNASNARRYNFGFADGRAFHVIATDGGLLAAPVEARRLQLSPAERAEVLVDFSDSAPIVLMSYAVDDGQRTLQKILFGRSDRPDDTGEQFKIVEFRPVGERAATARLPQTLRPVARMAPDERAKARRFKLGATAINGRRMDQVRIDQVVVKGATEVWRLQSSAPVAHPIHVHGAQFQILDRNGASPLPHELGWKDTVVVRSEEVVRIVIRFADYADPHLPYMFHCHNLEHEDMGMMGQFVVVNDASDEVGILAAPRAADGMAHGWH
jgi:bilirubin oxidase